MSEEIQIGRGPSGRDVQTAYRRYGAMLLRIAVVCLGSRVDAEEAVLDRIVPDPELTERLERRLREREQAKDGRSRRRRISGSCRSAAPPIDCAHVVGRGDAGRLAEDAAIASKRKASKLEACGIL
ncbi:hypothetical protein IDH44_06255 [Paenibacillus sp. IB182496]|uniref:Uncharacterized protein n=1 Tax=Paenibacillus sabuli TaxID=2772509 RepID=A0A927GRK9_9BACL|nr:hypothetical protein [Paenibacillus sabuli]MBD2844787.1 hypothetical protein [Paenibacillus sabuli]